MRVGNYTVLVTGGVERRSGRVNVICGQRFSIKVLSHDNRACDAVVCVDGVCVYKDKIPPNDSVVIDGWGEDEPFVSGETTGDIVVKCKRAKSSSELVEIVLTINPVPVTEAKSNGVKPDRKGTKD